MPPTPYTAFAFDPSAEYTWEDPATFVEVYALGPTIKGSAFMASNLLTKISFQQFCQQFLNNKSRTMRAKSRWTL